MRVLEQVAAGVWVATSPVWRTTSTVVVAPGGDCLLIDPALTPAEIDALAREITARGWRVSAAFSTHPHWDHQLWSAALPDVPRWATDTAVLWSRDHMARIAAEAAHDLPGHAWQVIGGTTALEGRAEVPWAGPRAVVLDTGAHASGHASLLLPTERVLVAGDLLSDVEVPLLDPDAADPVGDYRRVLLDLAGVVEDCLAVVPGHGRVTDGPGAVRRIAADLRYLEDLTAGREPSDLRLCDRRIHADHVHQRHLFGAP